MKRYRQSTGGGLFAAIEHEQAVASKTTGFETAGGDRLERFRPLLEELSGYAQRDWSKGGKPPFDPVLMFKVLCCKSFTG
ncbi:MAG: hypothetical protein WDN28_25470 [Chthoniobacter sp.]